MLLRYAGLLLLLAPSLATAQLNSRANYHELKILSPASLMATISNFVDYSTIPQPPYTIPDTTGVLPIIIGVNVFFYVDPTTGDSISVGTTIKGWGPQGPLALALDASGAPALGCLSEADSTSDFANNVDLAGTIALVQRGVCPFYLKARSAQRAGAVAFIVYNPSDRVPDQATNMGGGSPGDDFIHIPGAFLPWDLAEPLFNAVTGGETVTAMLACDFAAPSNFCIVDAAEGGPSASGAGLFFAGENPARTARLVVRAPSPETVTVTAHDMTGREVARLHSGLVVGERVVTLGAAGLPAGVYFVRATGETFQHTQQVTIVR